jgi:hypothetical protein
MPPAFGQGNKRSPASQVVAAKNLTDDFAKSALRVLKMIEAETGEPSLAQNGGILVPRTTNQAIDDLDVDAETKTDQAVVSVLHRFFIAKLEHNTAVSILSSMADSALVLAHHRDGPSQVSDIVSQSPTVAKINAQESACSSELESALRSRNYHEVPACTKEALEIETPKTLDVSVK